MDKATPSTESTNTQLYNAALSFYYYYYYYHTYIIIFVIFYLFVCIIIRYRTNLLFLSVFNKNSLRSYR